MDIQNRHRMDMVWLFSDLHSVLRSSFVWSTCKKKYAVGRGWDGGP